MLHTNYILSIALGFILLFSGCDDDSYITDQGDPEVNTPRQSESKVDAPYAKADEFQVQFNPLNADAGYRAVKGNAKLRIIGDKLTVQVNATGLQPGMLHPQHIHAAGSCPPSSSDTNNDGFIDVVEGVPFYGGIFVPLDEDLADLSFQPSFPIPTNRAGAITYKQSVSVNELTSATGEDLNLEGRHLVLHGVSAETDLPESVQSLGGLPASLTLPIACGEVKRVN